MGWFDRVLRCSGYAQGPDQALSRSGAKSRDLRRDEVCYAGLCVSRVERVSANYSRRLDSWVRLGAADGACSVDEWHGCFVSRVRISSVDIVSPSWLRRYWSRDSPGSALKVHTNPHQLTPTHSTSTTIDRRANQHRPRPTTSSSCPSHPTSDWP